MTDEHIHLAPWALNVEATIGASIYALPSQDRIRGALAAHAAGLWVHADLILKQGSGGEVVNLGVEMEQIKSCVEQAPGLRMDIHLIVLPGTQHWEPAVDRVAAELAGAVSARWSASRPVLDRLAPLLPVNSEKWVEFWPPRDGSSSPSADGVLAMLIEPGTKGDADLASTNVLASMAQEVRVGVDGGVTLSVASSALAAGAEYLVVGRALFGLAQPLGMDRLRDAGAPKRH